MHHPRLRPPILNTKIASSPTTQESSSFLKKISQQELNLSTITSKIWPPSSSRRSNQQSKHIKTEAMYFPSHSNLAKKKDTRGTPYRTGEYDIADNKFVGFIPHFKTWVPTFHRTFPTTIKSKEGSHLPPGNSIHSMRYVINHCFINGIVK